jgi:hypothetical protein
VGCEGSGLDDPQTAPAFYHSPVMGSQDETMSVGLGRTSLVVAASDGPGG